MPKSRDEPTRVDAHRAPLDRPRHPKRVPYRQKPADRTPRALSDSFYEEVFAALTTNRDRAIVATAVSAGLRASELLSMRRGMLHAADQTADVIPKGAAAGAVSLSGSAPLRICGSHVTSQSAQLGLPKSQSG